MTFVPIMTAIVNKATTIIVSTTDTETAEATGKLTMTPAATMVPITGTNTI